MRIRLKLALAVLATVTLAGCQHTPAGEPEPGASTQQQQSQENNVSLTIEAAKAESVRIQNELIALIPDADRAPEELPAPGSIARTPMSCDAEGQYRYPGGTAVRLASESTDAEGIADSLRQHLRQQGWSGQDLPTASQPNRVMFTNTEGYEAIIATLNRDDDLPTVRIDVWSPCATIPEDANPYAFKI
nr:hypothetical protein [Pseudoclavibacter sp. Marseille-Q3772]